MVYIYPTPETTNKSQPLPPPDPCPSCQPRYCPYCGRPIYHSPQHPHHFPGATWQVDLTPKHLVDMQQMYPPNVYNRNTVLNDYPQSSASATFTGTLLKSDTSNVIGWQAPENRNYRQ